MLASNYASDAWCGIQSSFALHGSFGSSVTGWRGRFGLGRKITALTQSYKGTGDEKIPLKNKPVFTRPGYWGPSASGVSC